MKDEEFIILRNRILFGLLIVIIFAIPTFFVIKNKLLVKETSIIKQINNKENFVILVTKENCTNCKDYEKELKNLNVEYSTLKKDTSESYTKVLDKLSINENDIIPPTIIYVEEGILKSTLVDIKNNNEIKEFIENYELSK